MGFFYDPITEYLPDDFRRRGMRAGRGKQCWHTELQTATKREFCVLKRNRCVVLSEGFVAPV